jgi:hypothetical protein
MPNWSTVESPVAEDNFGICGMTEALVAGVFTNGKKRESLELSSENHTSEVNAERSRVRWTAIPNSGTWGR